MPWPWTATDAAECLGNQNGWDAGQFSNGIIAAPGNVTRCRQTPQSSEKFACSNTNNVLRIKNDRAAQLSSIATWLRIQHRSQNIPGDD